MSANPTNITKNMPVNIYTVNQFNNLVTPPNMNTPVMLVKSCSICHALQWDQPDATSFICSVCQATARVLDHDPHCAMPPHSPKKAVICGISYQNSSHKLEGSIKDAKSMKDLLTEHFHFKESDIVMLTEEETHPLKTPTKDNLLKALHWLGQDNQPRGSLVFYYSGHGLQLRDYRQGEVDGYNETLCPMDFEKNGMIFNNYINAAIVSHLRRGVKLHAIIDSRHKKSVLELPYLYRKNRSGQYEWENHGPRSGELKGTSGGNAISFSGSVDVLTSADTPLLSKTTSPGLMTSSFIKAIKDGHGQTYWSILDSMQKTITNTGGKLRQECCKASELQEPLLSACGPFDVKETFTL